MVMRVTVVTGAREFYFIFFFKNAYKKNMWHAARIKNCRFFFTQPPLVRRRDGRVQYTFFSLSHSVFQFPRTYVRRARQNHKPVCTFGKLPSRVKFVRKKKNYAINKRRIHMDFHYLCTPTFFLHHSSSFRETNITTVVSIILFKLFCFSMSLIIF